MQISVLKCVAVCCSVLQCVAVCCSMYGRSVEEWSEPCRLAHLPYSTPFLHCCAAVARNKQKSHVTGVGMGGGLFSKGVLLVDQFIFTTLLDCCIVAHLLHIIYKLVLAQGSG